LLSGRKFSAIIGLGLIFAFSEKTLNKVNSYLNLEAFKTYDNLQQMTKEQPRNINGLIHKEY